MWGKIIFFSKRWTLGLRVFMSTLSPSTAGFSSGTQGLYGASISVWYFYDWSALAAAQKAPHLATGTLRSLRISRWELHVAKWRVFCAVLGEIGCAPPTWPKILDPPPPANCMFWRIQLEPPVPVIGAPSGQAGWRRARGGSSLAADVFTCEDINLGVCF